MKSRSGLFLSCAAGALLIGLGPVTQAAKAADLPVKAPVAAPEAPWWTHGFIELGGRDFLNDPPRNGYNWQGQRSLAKYYEYSTIKPGAFADFYIATGSGNGRYQLDFYGKNVGYSDQRFDASFSEVDKQYLDFQWDQTPHVYSTSASTLFNTSGNALTLANPDVARQLWVAGGSPAGGALGTANAFNTANAGAVGAVINNNVQRTDIGIRRDTAAVDYRYKPDGNWDITANYSNMRREGSQWDGVVMGANTGAARADVAKPVADTTHNFGVNGEYIGVSPWGMNLTAQIGYLGSVYSDDFSSYTVQNPWCYGGATGGTACLGAATTSPLARMSTPPSNNMNSGTGTVGMELPLDSRYMGTVTYSTMRQNDQFIPFTINTNLPATALINGASPSSLASLPRQSLNGEINTLLVNNVVTTQINPNLKTKLSYRYYDYDNQTPALFISNFLYADGNALNNVPTNALMLAYRRQNAAAEVNWRPANSVNIGSSYNWEHNDYTRFAALGTNENTGKIYADWQPEKWLKFRTSGSYGSRSSVDYDARNNFQLFQWAVGSGVPGAPALNATTGALTHSATTYYREFYLDDRNRAQAKAQVDIDVIRNLTVTPNVTWRDDDFRLQDNQVGLAHDRSVAGGVDVAYAASPDLRFLFSYMNESRQQLTYGTNTQLATAAFPNTATSYGASAYWANIKDRENTFVVGVNWAPVPSRLELGLTYTAAYGKLTSPLFNTDGTLPTAATGGQFPDVTTKLQRLEATGKYVIDPEVTRARGIPGEVALKLRYAWERNSVNNWQVDELAPYLPTTSSLYNTANFGNYQALAGDNPNYNVHMLAGSVTWAW